MNLSHLLAMSPCPRGTHSTFSGQEDGSWIVEIDASPKGDIAPQRIRILFQGVVQARLNNEYDQTNDAERVLSILSNSLWLVDFERSYVQRHGVKFLAFVKKDVQHFVVHGHDLSIGVLARKIACERI